MLLRCGPTPETLPCKLQLSVTKVQAADLSPHLGP